MKKNSLTPNKGLSLSQAQSISNLCNQRATEIANNLLSVNNYTKTVNVLDGATYKTLTIAQGKQLPTDVVALLDEKASLHACQAFLMENIKAKDAMIKDIKRAVANTSAVIFPEKPKLGVPKSLPEVGEEFGWEQLSVAEYNEYLEAEAYASHIGQFIHKDSILAGLRAELPGIPAIDWIELETGRKSPITIKVHHTASQLLDVHEKLAAKHREFEQKVNYFKAKVKNLTTEENARIAKLNADEQNETSKLNNDLQTTYDTAQKKANEEVRNVQAEFEKTRQDKIKEIAGMRIDVDPRFQGVVDTFLKQLLTK
jgi:hypothetical protein